MPGLDVSRTLNAVRRPTSGWTSLIDDICAGTWINPLTGHRPASAFDSRIVIEESLAGKEAQLIAGIGFNAPFVVVSDQTTHRVMGARIARALSELGKVAEIVLDRPHADMQSVRSLSSRLKPQSSIVAVGSGTVNDLVKFAAFNAGRRYCIFATAGSMNGYASSTASITLDSGLKVSLPARLPAGFFVDLEVSAQAPFWLNAAGFGDSVCRSVAQIDWWMAHRLRGTPYRHEPYLIEIPDELILMEQAEGIARGDINAVGALFRVLTLCGLGITFTGVSNHGSMGEHQISHYIDCFAAGRHSGSTHGQQVGVATLSMARIQRHFLASETPPEIAPTAIDPDDMARRMGKEIADLCVKQIQKKVLDERAADRFNKKLARIWPELRSECLEMTVQAEQLGARLQKAGGPVTARELGIPVEFYREAVCHAHEMRNRFSFADIACGAGVLSGLAQSET